MRQRYQFKVTIPDGPAMPSEIDFLQTVLTHAQVVHHANGAVMTAQFPPPFSDLIIFHGEHLSLEKTIRLIRAYEYFYQPKAEGTNGA